jgi:serine/threonine-protein kinase
MVDRTDEKRFDSRATDVEPLRLPTPPHGVSRIDTLPLDFISTISRRPLQIGDVIASRYRLVEELGNGAMGQVFVAENEAIGRRVAIKVLKPDLLFDASFRQRFQHEAMAIAAVEHRNAARFIDLIVGDPTFLVMEFVPGPTLATVLKKEGHFEPTRAINLATRLCWALDAVHSAHIVHRDIKPANVVLAPDPELIEEPKLIDFGLAKLAFARPEDQVTRDGHFVGTPHYMAPEQIASRPVDARADVYTLACLLYHLVAGRPPFGHLGDEVQVLYGHMQETPELLRTQVPEAPEELEQLLQRALSKDPAARFASMREMADALSAIDRRRPPEVRTAAAPAPSRRRTGLAVALLSVGFVSGAAVTGTLAGRLQRSHGNGLVFVSSDPPGASIEVDGMALGLVTPHAVNGLAAGEHTIRVSKQGGATVETVVALASGAQSEVRVALPPASRPVEIQTVPAGALVYLDGHPIVGETPLTLHPTENDFHEVRIERPGFQPELISIKPEDHESTISARLRPETEPYGMIWVDGSAGARVFVDATDTGFTTPTVGMRTPAGDHLVELRTDDGTVVASTRTRLRKGETIRIAPASRVRE